MIANLATVAGDHAAAFLGPLKSATPTLKVFDSSVDANTVLPYLVVYVSVTAPEEASLEDATDRVLCEATAHYVAGNAEATRVMQGRAWSVLLGVRPVIAGRDCSRIRVVDSQPPRRDESTGRVVMDQVDVFQFASVPG